jgi:hypothetical protein
LQLRKRIKTKMLRPIRKMMSLKKNGIRKMKLKRKLKSMQRQNRKKQSKSKLY